MRAARSESVARTSTVPTRSAIVTWLTPTSPRAGSTLPM
jgi:hypothetical protein